MTASRSVLVTGATGFLGRHLVARLRAEGRSVIALARTPQPGAPAPGLTWRAPPQGIAAWQDLLAGVETVHHLAWSTVPADSNLDPAEDARANLLPSLELIQAAASVSTGIRFVFASSGGAVYGPPETCPVPETHPLRPISAYGVSKAAVEHYLQFFASLGQLRPVALRIGNLYGPGQSRRRAFGAVSTFARRALAGEPITVFGDGSALRDYVYIDDVVEAFAHAAVTPTPDLAINIGGGQGRALTEVIAVIERQLGRPLDVTYSPPRQADVPVSVLDCARAHGELGWAPRMPFEDGVARTLAALKAEMAAR